MNALQRLVEQLKLEAGVERIKVRRAAASFRQGAGSSLPSAAAPAWEPGEERTAARPRLRAGARRGQRPEGGGRAWWAGGDKRAPGSAAGAECPGGVAL